MSGQHRDEGGRFGEKVSEQDILKAFDAVDEPFLASSDLADELPVSREAVNYRLNQMHEAGRVGRKEIGARAVGWWAKVAPRLSDEARRRADAADPHTAVSLDELEAEFAHDA